jgi:hypothetical protein
MNLISFKGLNVLFFMRIGTNWFTVFQISNKDLTNGEQSHQITKTCIVIVQDEQRNKIGLQNDMWMSQNDDDDDF